MNRAYRTWGAAALLLLIPAIALAADPSGAATGGIANVPAAEAGNPTMAETGFTRAKNASHTIFVRPLERVIRIRTGEADVEALTPEPMRHRPAAR